MRELRKLNDLTGYSFQAKDGAIGRLEEVYFDDHRWRVRYLVVRTGNWLFGRQVLLLPAVIGGIDDENRLIQVELTREQIEHAPPIDSEQPVSHHYQKHYYSYYNREPYWISDPLFHSTPLVFPVLQADKNIKPENPHLRSSDEISGYRLETEGGAVGHIEDLILDDQDWAVRYLEIDTRNWLPGRHVLISPAWVESIDWGTQQVQVKLSQQLVKSAPEYDSAHHISRDYQLALYKHYGKMFTE